MSENKQNTGFANDDEFTLNSSKPLNYDNVGGGNVTEDKTTKDTSAATRTGHSRPNDWRSQYSARKQKKPNSGGIKKVLKWIGFGLLGAFVALIIFAVIGALVGSDPSMTLILDNGESEVKSVKCINWDNIEGGSVDENTLTIPYQSVLVSPLDNENILVVVNYGKEGRDTMTLPQILGVLSYEETERLRSYFIDGVEGSDTVVIIDNLVSPLSRDIWMLPEAPSRAQWERILTRYPNIDGEKREQLAQMALYGLNDADSALFLSKFAGTAAAEEYRHLTSRELAEEVVIEMPEPVAEVPQSQRREEKQEQRSSVTHAPSTPVTSVPSAPVATPKPSVPEKVEPVPVKTMTPQDELDALVARLDLISCSMNDVRAIEKFVKEHKKDRLDTRMAKLRANAYESFFAGKDVRASNFKYFTPEQQKILKEVFFSDEPKLMGLTRSFLDGKRALKRK